MMLPYLSSSIFSPSTFNLYTMTRPWKLLFGYYHMSIIMVTFNLGAGHLLSRVQPYMPIYIFSGLLLTIGGSLIVVYLKSSTSISIIYGLSIINAVGTGLTTQLGYAVASLVVEPQEVGDAISLQNLSQLGANLISLVIAGQIFQAEAVENLERVLAGTNYSHQGIVDAVSGAQSTLFQQISGKLRDQAVNAITKLFGEIVAVGA